MSFLTKLHNFWKRKYTTFWCSDETVCVEDFLKVYLVFPWHFPRICTIFILTTQLLEKDIHNFLTWRPNGLTCGNFKSIFGFPIAFPTHLYHLKLNYTTFGKGNTQLFDVETKRFDLKMIQKYIWNPHCISHTSVSFLTKLHNFWKRKYTTFWCRYQTVWLEDLFLVYLV